MTLPRTLRTFAVNLGVCLFWLLAIAAIAIAIMSGFNWAVEWITP